MDTMNKKELITKVRDNAKTIDENITFKTVETVLSSFLDVVKDTLADGGKVALHGFGTFEVVERAARNGHNPKTGQSIVIPESKAPKFKASKVLKDAVNG